MSTIKISDDTFEENVINSGKPIIIDFWAEWCAPCKQIGPILEEISDEYNDKLTIGKLDVDENPETPGKYQIRGIPTMLLFNNGKLVDTKVGMSSKTDLKEWIEKHI
jgi:thioredoxin 1